VDGDAEQDRAQEFREEKRGDQSGDNAGGGELEGPGEDELQDVLARGAERDALYRALIGSSAKAESATRRGGFQTAFWFSFGDVDIAAPWFAASRAESYRATTRPNRRT
jgi:hypothetical protein